MPHEDISGLLLTGTTELTLNDITPTVDLSNIVNTIYEVNRATTTLTGKSNYIVIDYDINSHVYTHFTISGDTSPVHSTDDAWLLNGISLKLVDTSNNSDASDNLYDLSNVYMHLPTESKVLVLANVNVVITQDPSNNVDMNTVTNENTVLDLCCNVGLKDNGRYTLSGEEVTFNGDLVTYILKENPAEFQIAGYKIDGTTDISSSSALLKAAEYDYNGNNQNDYLQVTLSTTSNLSVPNVNHALLKTWYKDSIDTLVNMVEDTVTITDVSFTINELPLGAGAGSTTNTLSKWARTKITEDSSGNAVWNDDATRDLADPFAEGEYLICSSPYTYKPKVTDIDGTEHEYNTTTGGNCYVVLKQVTGKNAAYYGQ